MSVNSDCGWDLTGVIFSMYCIQHCFTCRPSDSHVSEDAEIEPKTVATLALTVRRSNHSARYHPLWIYRSVDEVSRVWMRSSQVWIKFRWSRVWMRSAAKLWTRFSGVVRTSDCQAVLRILIRDPVPFWPLDPGSGIGFFQIPDPKPKFWELSDDFWGKKFHNSLKIGPNFSFSISKLFSILWNLWLQKKV